MQIFQGNESALRERFHLSPFAIVVVGILRSKNIFLSEPLLELCSMTGPLKTMLKDRSILAALEQPENLKEWQAKHDPEQAYPLVLLDHGSHRVLALEDEVLAETFWKQEASQPQDLQPLQPKEVATLELRL